MTRLFGDYTYNFNSHKKNGEILVRIFGGILLENDPTHNYSFKMGGWSGVDDYMYDHVYLGRSDVSGMPSRQFNEADGAFKVPTAIRSDKWLVATNIKIPEILGIPVGVYADAGTYDGAKVLSYNAGAMISAGGIFEVYFPFLFSSDINEELRVTGRDRFGDRIRFTLRLERLNPFRLLNDFAR
jgi:hypothetical protein